MMRIEKIPGFPFYVFLIPVFYVWHKMNEYFGLVPFKVGLEIFGEYIILLLIIVSIGWMLIRKLYGTAIWSSYIFSIYLFWGIFHDILKGWFGDRFYTSYSFLIPFLLLLSFIILFYQRKKRTLPIFWSRYLNLLLLVLLGIEMIVTFTSLIKNRADLEMIDYGLTPKVTSSELNKSSDNPDIYFIVFDEYMSNRGLKTYLNFDNSKLDSQLRSLAVFVTQNSKSNYNSTPHSIASSLNIDYFPVNLEGTGTEPRALLQGQLALKKALIPKLLSEVGYSIENYGRMDIANANSPFEPFFNRDQRVIFKFDNFWYRVRHEIWWNFTLRFPWLKDSDLSWKKDQAKRIEIFRSNYDKLMKSFDSIAQAPKFVFAHFLLPHPPYNFNSSGEVRDWTSLDRTEYSDSLYLDQVQFANTIITQICHKASKVKSRDKLLIIIGDHGFRDNDLKSIDRIRDKQFMNLTAIYSDTHNYRGFYDSISPVNIFRVVLNEHFGTNLPMLKDSTIMLE